MLFLVVFVRFGGDQLFCDESVQFGDSIIGSLLQLLVGWLVWFKRYILLGPRAGALTLLQGIWGGGRLIQRPARGLNPGPRRLNPGPRRGRQVSYLHTSLLPDFLQLLPITHAPFLANLLYFIPINVYGHFLAYILLSTSFYVRQSKLP